MSNEGRKQKRSQASHVRATAERPLRPPVERPPALGAYDSFSLARELAARGAVVKGRVMLPVLEPDGARPKTRADCIDGHRPCAWTRCRFHLWRIDGDDRPGHRNEKYEKPPSMVMPIGVYSCQLDLIAENPDGLSQTKVGEAIGMTGQRVSQLEKELEEKLDKDARGINEDLRSLYRDP